MPGDSRDSIGEEEEEGEESNENKQTDKDSKMPYQIICIRKDARR